MLNITGWRDLYTSILESHCWPCNRHRVTVSVQGLLIHQALHTSGILICKMAMSLELL